MRLSPLRMLSVLALAGVASMARAERFDVVTARQTAPGRVEVDLTIDPPVPPAAGTLALEIDGVRVPPTGDVAPVAAGGAPGWLVLCIDRSASIGEPALSELKKQLVATLGARGATDLGMRVAVLGFGTRAPVPRSTFSSRTAEVADAINALTVERDGTTVLNDAVTTALALLAAQGDGSRRVLVASDGRDTGSVVRQRELLQRVQTAPVVPIDTLSFGGRPGTPASEALARLAGASGGRFMQAHEVDRLAPAVRSLVAGGMPPVVLQARFSYPAATGGRQAAAADVIHGAAGQPPQRRALGITVAAVGAASASPGATGGAGDPARPSGGLMNALNDGPALLWYAGIALGLLVLLVLVLIRLARRRPVADDDPPASRPPPPPSSDHATRIVPPPSPPVGSPPRRAATVVGHAWPAPGAGHPAAILQGISGAVRGQRFAVERSPYRIGGAPGNDLVLVGDEFASGRHALLRCETAGLYVEDLGSTNGSRLNGATFKGATKALAPGDELQFGRTTLEVLAPAAPRSGPSGGGREPRVP